jgi:hypothetical protein
MTTIHARPGLNGNTPADFQKAASALQDAVAQVRAALRNIRGNCLHGRNYQTIADGYAIRAIDLKALDEAMEATAPLVALSAAIYDAGRTE